MAYYKTPRVSSRKSAVLPNNLIGGRTRISKEAQQITVRVLLHSIRKFSQGNGSLGRNLLRQKSETTPNLTTRKRPHAKVGNDTKVQGTPLQSPEQVGVCVCVGSNDTPIRQHNLESDDIITGEPVSRGEEGVATTEDQPRDTDIPLATPGDGPPVLPQLGVDLPPATTGPDVDRLGGGVVARPAEPAEVDGHAVPDVVGTRPLRVASAPDGEGDSGRD